MEYFDKQDSNKAAQQQENYNHNQPQEQPGYHLQSKNIFPDNWKVPQDGDFDFVSCIIHESVLPLLYLIVLFKVEVVRHQWLSGENDGIRTSYHCSFAERLYLCVAS